MVDAETIQFFTALLPAVDAVAEDLTEDEGDWLVWLAAGETMRKMAGKTNWSERRSGVGSRPCICTWAWRTGTRPWRSPGVSGWSGQGSSSRRC